MAGYKKRITGSGKGKNIGTEGMYEKMPAWTGLTSSYGKISSRRNISGPTQKNYEGTKSSVTTKYKTINPVTFWMKNLGPGAKITGIGAISAGSALSTKKKKQKKRVGRTILTSN